jgi:hypothetical protein
MIAGIKTFLKRITHRELSPENLKKTQEGFLKEDRNHVRGIGKDLEYTTVDEEPQLRITNRTLRSTPDISHPQIQHTNFYADKTTFFRYNTNGQLLEKAVTTRNILDINPGGTLKVIRFEPPGCWRGQKVDETNRRYNTMYC